MIAWDMRPLWIVRFGLCEAAWYHWRGRRDDEMIRPLGRVAWSKPIDRQQLADGNGADLAAACELLATRMRPLAAWPHQSVAVVLDADWPEYSLLPVPHADPDETRAMLSQQLEDDHGRTTEAFVFWPANPLASSSMIDYHVASVPSGVDDQLLNLFRKLGWDFIGLWLECELLQRSMLRYGSSPSLTVHLSARDAQLIAGDGQGRWLQRNLGGFGVQSFLPPLAKCFGIAPPAAAALWETIDDIKDQTIRRRAIQCCGHLWEELGTAIDHTVEYFGRMLRCNAFPTVYIHGDRQAVELAAECLGQTSHTLLDAQTRTGNLWLSCGSIFSSWREA